MQFPPIEENPNDQIRPKMRTPAVNQKQLSGHVNRNARPQKSTYDTVLLRPNVDALQTLLQSEHARRRVGACLCEDIGALLTSANAK